jgi:NAD(P)-dependent dehydrogenase (short-subunit alcohol dehydrogenase family)
MSGMWLRPINPPMRDWRGQRVWLIGASSGIGEATARALHAAGAQVVVSARNAVALDAWAAKHPGSAALALDVTDAAAVADAARALLASGGIDLVMYCAGHYREMRADAFDLAEIQRHWRVNFDGALYVLDALLPVLRRQGRGHISVVSSVAGFRGLPKSLAYGPTKAALINLAETLYLDLRHEGVGVSVVNPGFVETPLTAHNDFHMPGLITPDQAAQAILRGWAAGKFEIDFPKRFTFWMRLLRLLPSRPYFAAVARITGL